MKRNWMMWSLVVLAASNLSMMGDRFSTLLSEEDREQEQFDTAQGPALSAPPGSVAEYWESFNHWQCFSLEDIEKIECVEEDYDGIKFVPTLRINFASHRYEFSLDPSPEPDCDKVIRLWDDLLHQEDAFCAYAAYLQPLETDSSLWIVHRIKTAKGYWDYASDENWHQPEDGD